MLLFRNVDLSKLLVVDEDSSRSVTMRSYAKRSHDSHDILEASKVLLASEQNSCMLAIKCLVCVFETASNL